MSKYEAKVIKKRCGSEYVGFGEDAVGAVGQAFADVDSRDLPEDTYTLVVLRDGVEVMSEALKYLLTGPGEGWKGEDVWSVVMVGDTWERVKALDA